MPTFCGEFSGHELDGTLTPRIATGIHAIPLSLNLYLLVEGVEGCLQTCDQRLADTGRGIEKALLH
jgi:hypothetical protein